MGNQLCQSVQSTKPPIDQNLLRQDEIYNPHKKYQSVHGNFLQDKLIIQNNTKSHEKIVNQLRHWDKQLNDEVDAQTRQYLQKLINTSMREVNGEISLMRYRREKSIEGLTFDYQNYD